MICPNCGKETEFIEVSHVAREPHGEVHEDEWLVCVACNARCEFSELIEPEEIERTALERAYAR